ncbi:uncharacterized protein DSM5745_10662 [Aspergillus mulundensis]|uniref:CCHC-type domain-containing protein n=1 Tax=Aspergillus mulundensis TaxID=1810919 RepID=A0A3D8QIC2_9EURO|nr:hypothetical protein DSM5745_10662 [Aspergillus mulundensis]RDW61164.1 hypothetical protein DSM5745_10662 [Aspergillus mulundensis]
MPRKQKRASVVCAACGGKGHFARECPSRSGVKKQETTHLNTPRNTNPHVNICGVCWGGGHFAPDCPSRSGVGEHERKADCYRPAQAPPPPPPPPPPRALPRNSVLTPSGNLAPLTGVRMDPHEFTGVTRDSQKPLPGGGTWKPAFRSTRVLQNRPLNNVPGQFDNRPKPLTHPDCLALMSSRESATPPSHNHHPELSEQTPCIPEQRSSSPVDLIDLFTPPRQGLTRNSHPPPSNLSGSALEFESPTNLMGELERAFGLLSLSRCRGTD